MAALGAPLNAMAAEPAFVKCRWESGTYPTFLISGNENGGYGIYKIESAAMELHGMAMGRAAVLYPQVLTG
jgi:hypothetical protein